MSKADKAIIMAAGLGSRMRPVTDYMPKPLIEIHGVKMIETIIDALRDNNISDIYIVVGYLKEKFSYLVEKYNNVHLIENPYYDSCNNISSLYMARNYISNCFIIDGDQIIKNKKIFDMEIIDSGYMCVWTEEPTNEWLLEVQENHVVNCSRTGGNCGWQLFGISFWNEEDGKKLREHLEIEFLKKNNRQIYWDDVALFCYPKEYKLGIKQIKKEDVIEVDSFNELCRLDNSYLSLIGG